MPKTRDTTSGRPARVSRASLPMARQVLIVTGKAAAVAGLVVVLHPEGDGAAGRRAMDEETVNRRRRGLKSQPRWADFKAATVGSARLRESATDMRLRCALRADTHLRGA